MALLCTLASHSVTTFTVH